MHTDVVNKSNKKKRTDIAPGPGGHGPQRPCTGADMCKTDAGSGVGADTEQNRGRSNHE